MKIITIFIISIIINISLSHAALIDKTIAIIDTKVITLSLVKRIYNNILARAMIAPHIYINKKPSYRDIINIEINTHIIRNKLTSIGYVITDEQVSLEVKNTKKRL